MRITIINPTSLCFSFGHQWKVHNYFSKYIQKYKPNVYFTDLKKYALLPLFCQKTGTKLSDLNIINSIGSLKRNTDVLLYPWGIGDGEQKRIKKISTIFKQFTGMKVFHVMDHQYLASTCNEMLETSGVDYVMGYARHDIHSSFFRHMYPKYDRRVIDIPFGFDDEWTVRNQYQARLNRCLGTGTIEPFESENIKRNRDKLTDYLKHFGWKYHCMHELRYLVNEAQRELRDIMDCRFHTKNKKDANYVPDVVGLFNEYKLFVNDESLLNFPPIRTYEGIAAGCVMVCNKNGCYEEIGFKDKINCIMFKKYDLHDMAEKTRYYLFEKPEELEAIQKRAVEFVRARFNHSKVADLMHSKLSSAFGEMQREVNV